MAEGTIAAVILAAGYSTRMGEFKPLMELAGRPVAERVIETFRTAGVNDLIVVTGHQGDELEPLAARFGAQVVTNQDYDQGMFSSVQAGAAALSDECRAFFVHPVDIPLLRSTTISALLSGFEQGVGKVIHPTFLGQRGHPPLLDVSLRKAVANWPGEGGLAGLLEAHEDQAAEVPVADEYILADLDTPEQHQALSEACRRHAIPTINECLALLGEVMAAPPELVAHSRAVAVLSLHLARELNRAGCDLDPDLVAAAGLLHDVAKGRPGHADAAADLLARMGWAAVGRVAGLHVDLVVDPGAQISEAEVVHLADKCFEGQTPQSPQKRFAAKLDKYGVDPEAREAIKSRQALAKTIAERMEQVLGRELVAVIAESPTAEQEGTEHDLLAAAWRD